MEHYRPQLNNTTISKVGQVSKMRSQTTNLEAMATLAPSSLNLKAIPFPRPVPPPEMKTTLLSKVPFGSIVSFLQTTISFILFWILLYIVGYKSKTNGTANKVAKKFFSMQTVKLNELLKSGKSCWCQS